VGIDAIPGSGGAADEPPRLISRTPVTRYRAAPPTSTARSISTASPAHSATSRANVTCSRSTVTVQPSATNRPRSAERSGPTSPGGVSGFAATKASMSRVGRSIAPSARSADPPG